MCSKPPARCAATQQGAWRGARLLLFFGASFYEPLLHYLENDMARGGGARPRLAVTLRQHTIFHHAWRGNCLLASSNQCLCCYDHIGSLFCFLCPRTFDICLLIDPSKLQISAKPLVLTYILQSAEQASHYCASFPCQQNKKHDP
jgi:hypothetical protein